MSGGSRPAEGTQPLVSIILVTWNSEPYLARCLDGIRHQTWSPVEIISVDNGSVDGSAEVVDPVASVRIRNETNRGFSVAVNQGIAAARGEKILLLNPDCYLLPEYTERLLAALAEAGEEFGSATGMLIRAQGTGIDPTGRIDSLGIRMTRSGRHLDLGQRARRDQHQSDRWFEVFAVSGAAAMFRKAFLDDASIDGEAFDEDFFAYREDADLGWRGRLFGWRALCEPRAVAYHVRRVTPEARRELSEAINMHSVKNRFLLRAKNQGLYLAIRNAPFELARDAVVLGAALTIERSSLSAFSWLWKNRKRVAAKRREIQRRRTVSDRQLARWFR